jgi:hypothetical protein
MTITAEDYMNCTNHPSFLALEKHPKSDDSFDGVVDIEFYFDGKTENSGFVQITYW